VKSNLSLQEKSTNTSLTQTRNEPKHDNNNLTYRQPYCIFNIYHTKEMPDASY